jgi:starch synthase
VWDPAKDSKIAAHYTPERLEGKVACRKDLLHAFGVSNRPEDMPVLGLVSRLATQKGFDLLAQAFDQLVQQNMLLIILGTGEPYYENLLRGWQERFPDKVAVKITYDETLAHKVIAGSDMTLMPSRSEPCGFNQFYGMKYGTVPVVRATGGLDDTVQEWSPAEETGTGFRFVDYRPEELLRAMGKAFATFGDKKQWRKLMQNGMARDYSWTKPAKEYNSSTKRLCAAGLSISFGLYPRNNSRVPHISLVFREMWDTTGFPLKPSRPHNSVRVPCSH